MNVNTNAVHATVALQLLKNAHDRLDKQNIYLFLSSIDKNWLKKIYYKDCYLLCFVIGQKFLGAGFTTYKPEKFKKKYMKMFQIKGFKSWQFNRYIRKTVSSNFDKKWVKDIFDDFYNFINTVWKKDKKILRKLDKELYKSIEKQVDKIIYK